jgi:DNA polymerase-3 subunit gamma/tau
MAFKLPQISMITIRDHVVKIASSEGYAIENEGAEMIAEEASGSVREALSLLEQAIMLSEESKNITNTVIIGMLGGCRRTEVEELLNLIIGAKPQEALRKSEDIIKSGGDPYSLYKNLQTALYRLITGNLSISCKHSLQNLLYMWQILQKQTENIKNTSRPEQILNVAIVILAYTASFPSIEELMLQEPNSSPKASKEAPAPQQRTQHTNKLINEIMEKFSGSMPYKVN